jgi:outer membrane protein OmpA-like peptidoglycan-associated protein
MVNPLIDNGLIVMRNVNVLRVFSRAGLRAFPLVFLLTPCFFSAPAFGQTGVSVGAGPEVNIVTLEEERFGVGGILSVENRFGPVFAGGVNISASYGWNNFIGLENRIFGRWYFVSTKGIEFFFQGDAGLLITLQPLDPLKSRGAPSAGLTLGTRIFLPGGWYLEPYARGGYPYLGGAGLLMGFSPARHRSLSAASSQANNELQSGEMVYIRRDLGSVPAIASLAIEPYIYFAPDIAAFTGLDFRTVENNYRLLQEIAGFLRSNTEYTLVIEGHANPVSNTRNEEAESLNPLSIKRAEVVANTLIGYGIDRKRFIIAGSGGTKTLVPWTDRNHWHLNRRVEFTLTRQAGKQRSIL